MSDEIYDRGAQFERTALSLNRTLLALAANGALLLKVGGSMGSWVTVLGAIVLVVSLAGWALGGRAYRSGRGVHADSLLRKDSWVLALTVVAVLIGLVDIAAILSYA